MKPKNKPQKPTQAMIDLLRATASSDTAIANKSMQALAAALQEPLREGLLNGDILDNIFSVEQLQPGATAEYSLDLYQQHMDGQYTAYQIPSEGAIPTRTVSSDSVTIQTYTIANGIDWLLKYARDARWDVVSRVMEVFNAGFVRKINTDGWHALIGAAAGRTDYLGGAPMIFDSAASVGQFTKRLVSLMKTSMARLSGGNSTSANRGRLTDIYMSLEALEDIRNWTTADDGVDDFTLRDIFLAQDTGGVFASIYGVALHPLYELGVGQEFQNFFDTLGVSMGTSDEEIVVGLDLTKNDSFVMPVREPLQVFDDPTLHRRQRQGVYGWTEFGVAVLDPRRVILGSL